MKRYNCADYNTAFIDTEDGYWITYQDYEAVLEDQRKHYKNRETALIEESYHVKGALELERKHRASLLKIQEIDQKEIKRLRTLIRYLFLSLILVSSLELIKAIM